MLEKTTVCAVVVTYNRKEMLLQCIDAIFNQTLPVYKLVILDNNSSDGTEQLLEEKGYLSLEKIVFKKLEKNTGGAGGFNAGMKIADEFNPNWIWIMDDDVIPEEDCLEELLNADSITKEEVSF